MHPAPASPALAEPSPLGGAVLRGPSRPDLLREECLADILTASARRRPDHPALIWGARVVTYKELDAAAEKLACTLAQRGAAPGRVLGLFLPRGADLLIAQAGITKSGAAWLPCDADTPLERIKLCLDSAQAAGLVTFREWLPRLQGFSMPVWALEDLAESESSKVPRVAAKSSDAAYVIYTSGSTGQPKGIVISHRSICHFLRAENEMLGVREDDRVYQGFSVAFDMSFEEIWISYLVGATLWIAPAAVVRDPDLLTQSLAREGLTVLHAVPTLMALLPEPPPSVRLINLGGKPVLIRWRNDSRALGAKFLTPTARRKPPSLPASSNYGGANRSASAGRCPITVCLSWTNSAARCRLGPRANCAFSGRVWLSATLAVQT